MTNLVPVVHWEHSEAPTLLYLPDGHDEHDPDPGAPLKVSTPQSRQLVISSEEYLPEEHVPQVRLEDSSEGYPPMPQEAQASFAGETTRG